MTTEIIKVEITDEQRANLDQLATYLENFQPTPACQFDMSRYDEFVDDSAGHAVCGSVGCAVGHGPYAGIPKRVGESWNKYAARCFVGLDEELWDWLFTCSWELVDNTPSGAAKRIRLVLEHGGYPEDYGAQIDQDEPLCYV